MSRQGVVQYEPVALAFTTVPNKLARLLSQRSRWARGMCEGLRIHPPPKQPRVLAKLVASIDYLVPILDIGLIFFWLPGLILLAFGYPLIVGWWSILLLPLTLAIFGFLRWWQERHVFHRLHIDPGRDTRGLWNSGWLELHSIDWIAKIDPPARATTSGRVAACVEKGGSPTPVDQDISPPPAWFAQHDSNDTLHYCTLIDERFTTLGQVGGLQIQKTSPDVIHVSLTLNPSAAQSAAFTASIVMWWAGASDQSLDPACHGAPST